MYPPLSQEAVVVRECREKLTVTKEPSPPLCYVGFSILVSYSFTIFCISFVISL